MFSCICMTSMLLRWNIWRWTIVMRINGMYSYPHPIHLSIHHSLFSVWPCHLENQVSVVTEILIVLSPACKNSPLTWPSAHCPSLSKPGLVSWNAAFVLCFVKLHNGPDVVKLPYPLEHCYVNTTMDVIINHVTYVQTLMLLCAQYDAVTSHWQMEKDNLSIIEEKCVDYIHFQASFTTLCVKVKLNFHCYPFTYTDGGIK